MQNPFVRIKPAAPALAGLALFLAVLCLFLPCLRNDFINFDDPVYLLSNAHIQHGLDWQTIRWAFSTNYAANWHPLTWLSHALDWQFFGSRPWGHHLASVLIHAASALLLFIVLRKMTGAFWRSLFVAAIFGTHPLRVESVAWASERKDVLGAMFWMLTLWAYVEWVQRSANNKRGSGIFRILTVAFLALGLMSKPMLVTLPFALLLLDYWPLGRLARPAEIRRSMVEKIPLFLLAMAACLVTYHVQKLGGAIAIGDLNPGLGARIGNALVSYARYIGMLLVPVDLAIFYPLPAGGAWPLLQVLAAAALLLGITGATVMRRRRQPYLVTGWLWYLGTLLPVIGLMKVGTQALADRYTYVPLTGLILALTWGVCDLMRGCRFRAFALSAAASAVIAACGWLTLRQIAWWKDSETLFRRTLAVTPPNPVARDNLGCALVDKGEFDEAISHFREALNLTNSPEVHLNLGGALLKKGDFAEAAGQLQTVLAFSPSDDRAHFYLAIAFQGMGAWNEAAAEFRETTRLNPGFDAPHFLLGSLLGKLGDLDGAIAQYQAALRINPGIIDARNNLGAAFFRAKRWDEAIREFREVLRENPALAVTRNNLGLVYENEGKLNEAIAEYREALRLQPDYAPARTNLEASLKIQADRQRP
jgi:tetratricopeptide (TPR) repeat protein